MSRLPFLQRLSRRALRTRLPADIEPDMQHHDDRVMFLARVLGFMVINAGQEGVVIQFFTSGGARAHARPATIAEERLWLYAMGSSAERNGRGAVE